jgi:ATP-dependent helicase/nuclease subunit A
MSDPRQLLDVTERAQQMASDPQASAWVGANAGAGKTHVLKMRVLKLLLAGTPPDKILCLTFTRAAAAEMAQRVFNELSQWATCDAETLIVNLEKLLGRQPTSEELSLARQLFARAIETPGGLKVQTIHAFCERLLQRFPLEAGVPPGFSILDDEASQTIRREAIDAVLLAAARDGGPVRDAMQKIVAFAVDDGFDTLLASALAQRKWLEAMSRLDLRDDFSNAKQIYCTALGVRAGSLADAEHQLAGVLNDEELTRAAAVLATGTVTDQRLGAVFKRAATASDAKARIAALTQCFLTSSGDPRQNLMTTKLRTSFPDLESALTSAQSQFIALREEFTAHVLIEATLALLCVANAVEQRCAEAKARRAALDYDDLIAKTASLLGNGSSTQWVLYKLDGGLDHVLVDEAQDTSPVQWSIVSALANEFFSGSSASETVRTVFAVGDEKQSIYSFQGAEPKEFAAAGQRFARLAAATEQIWRNLPLTLSFRSTAPVLDSVDRVFSDASRTPGLTAASGPVRHQAMRIGHAGLVELWPTEQWQQINPAEPWSPLTETAQQSPVAQLAQRIADTIAGWLETGERLASTGQPIRPGDILILVRKRAPFAAPMVSALKARGIAVAGSDRMQLNQQIAVQDLMALGEFLVLPEDDLALATVLKSPIFDLNDDDLLAIAPGRKGALWTALLEAAKTNARLAPAANTLRRWRAEADFRPPYEFFAGLLDNEGLRARMLSRLGPEAADPLDEFINLALTYDSRSPPSLQGFLLWLRRLKMEIKRDQEHGRDEVRVMTVHGAKGLEAPIVFLPDTCSTASPGDRGGLVKLANAVLPEKFPAPCIWPVRNTSHHGSVQAARQAVKAAEAEERNRLLYVAMTRAKDRLYVSGFEGKKGRGQDCWYDLVEAGLQNDCERHDTPDGRMVLRLSSPQLAPLKSLEGSAAKAAPVETLPAWARSKAPREPVATIPLAPSRLGPLETDDSGEPVEQPRTATREVSEPASVSPLALAADYRFLRGTLTHALLEHLPSLPQESWQAAATAFIALRGQGVSKRVQAGIVSEVLAILHEPTFGVLFGPDSRAEVPIAAEIPDPRGSRPTLRLTGQIDRFVRLPHEVMILDYKTNRPPPLDPAQVAPIYVSQLAAYRLAIKQIFPELPVRGAILWTDGCRLMPIPSEMLDEREDRLWEQGSARLDAV